MKHLIGLHVCCWEYREPMVGGTGLPASSSILLALPIQRPTPPLPPHFPSIRTRSYTPVGSSKLQTARATRPSGLLLFQLIPTVMRSSRGYKLPFRAFCFCDARLLKLPERGFFFADIYLAIERLPPE